MSSESSLRYNATRKKQLCHIHEERVADAVGGCRTSIVLPYITALDVVSWRGSEKKEVPWCRVVQGWDVSARLIPSRPNSQNFSMTVFRQC